jgi:hypothetical protein
VLVLSAVALSGVGSLDEQVAGAAPHETPARKITRLRAKAARVQAAVDRMHARVESLVEDYNEVREALAKTRTEQARTRRQVAAARRQLAAAKRLLGRRLWTIYTGGAPSTLGQLLGAGSVHDALVTTKYQEQVVGADQAERQERLQARLAAKRRQIESRLAAQRRYLRHLGRTLRRAVIEERRRQERLRRQALLRRLAAERAARARAAARSSRWWAGRAGPAPRPEPPPGRSRSPGASWASRICGGRPGRARTTARA